MCAMIFRSFFAIVCSERREQQFHTAKPLWCATRSCSEAPSIMQQTDEHLSDSSFRSKPHTQMRPKPTKGSGHRTDAHAERSNLFAVHPPPVLSKPGGAGGGRGISRDAAFWLVKIRKTDVLQLATVSIYPGLRLRMFTQLNMNTICLNAATQHFYAVFRLLSLLLFLCL